MRIQKCTVCSRTADVRAFRDGFICEECLHYVIEKF